MFILQGIRLIISLCDILGNIPLCVILGKQKVDDLRTPQIAIVISHVIII